LHFKYGVGAGFKPALFGIIQKIPGGFETRPYDNHLNSTTLRIRVGVKKLKKFQFFLITHHSLLITQYNWPGGSGNWFPGCEFQEACFLQRGPYCNWHKR
jgi:hypothetical protein